MTSTQYQKSYQQGVKMIELYKRHLGEEQAKKRIEEILQSLTNHEEISDSIYNKGKVDALMDYLYNDSNKQNTNMKKNTIKLNESQLRRIVRESIEEVVDEKMFDPQYNEKWYSPSSWKSKKTKNRMDQQSLIKKCDKYIDMLNQAQDMYDVMKVNKFAWKDGVRNKNLGKGGINRVDKEGDDLYLDGSNVYLGGVYGFWKHSLDYWERKVKQDDTESYNFMFKWYKYFVMSNIKAIRRNAEDSMNSIIKESVKKVLKETIEGTEEYIREKLGIVNSKISNISPFDSSFGKTIDIEIEKYFTDFRKYTQEQSDYYSETLDDNYYVVLGELYFGVFLLLNMRTFQLDYCEKEEFC